MGFVSKNEIMNSIRLQKGLYFDCLKKDINVNIHGFNRISMGF